MRVESRAQEISDSSSCSRTWSHDSRVQRKNPTLERSMLLRVERVIPVTLSSRRPVWVNPNSSMGIMGRLSDLILVERISAEERKTRDRRRRRVREVEWWIAMDEIRFDEIGSEKGVDRFS